MTENLKTGDNVRIKTVEEKMNKKGQVDGFAAFFIFLIMIIVFGAILIINYEPPEGAKVMTEMGYFKDTRTNTFYNQFDYMSACKDLKSKELSDFTLICVNNVKVEDQAFFVDECTESAIRLLCPTGIRHYEDIYNARKNLSND